MHRHEEKLRSRGRLKARLVTCRNDHQTAVFISQFVEPAEKVLNILDEPLEIIPYAFDIVAVVATFVRELTASGDRVVLHHIAFLAQSSFNTCSCHTKALHHLTVKKLLGLSDISAINPFTRILHSSEQRIQLFPKQDFSFFWIEKRGSRVPDTLQRFVEFIDVWVRGPIHFQRIPPYRQRDLLRMARFGLPIGLSHLPNGKIGSGYSQDPAQQCLEVIDKLADGIAADAEQFWRFRGSQEHNRCGRANSYERREKPKSNISSRHSVTAEKLEYRSPRPRKEHEHRFQSTQRTTAGLLP